MVCDLLDIRCILVNELVGSVTLTIILLMIGYFIIAAKSKFGFDTTIAFSIPVFLMLGVITTGFNLIYLLAAFIAGLMLALLLLRLIGNK